ncbi:MAG: hypothetical protein GY711_14915 [bacterium]|nr:hypothetical protein [bacterium]
MSDSLERAEGTVSLWLEEEGRGSIVGRDGRAFEFDARDIEELDFEQFMMGSSVRFTPDRDESGLHARRVLPVREDTTEQVGLD